MDECREAAVEHPVLIIEDPCFRVGLTCPINPEFSRMSGGARAPGSYRTRLSDPTRERGRAASHCRVRGAHIPITCVLSKPKSYKSKDCCRPPQPPMTWAEPRLSAVNLTGIFLGRIRERRIKIRAKLANGMGWGWQRCRRAHGS